MHVCLRERSRLFDLTWYAVDIAFVMNVVNRHTCLKNILVFSRGALFILINYNFQIIFLNILNLFLV